MAMRALRTIALCLICCALLSAGAPSIPSPPADAPDKPKDILDVREWWGFYTITVTGEASHSGKRDGLPWSNSRRFRRRSDGSFHLNKAMASGILPGHTADPPDLEAMMDKHRLRSWMSIFDMQHIPTALVTFEESTSATSDQPVEGKEVDHTGTDTTSSGHGEVKAPQPVQLVIDVKKKVYGLIFPYDTINTSAVQVTTKTYTWERMWDGRFTDSTRTATAGGVREAPEIPSDAHHKPEWIVDQPLPDGIGSLKGTVTYDVPLGHNSKEKIAHVEIAWFLSPKPPEDLELILAAADEGQYNQWRPRGALSEEQPGSRITVVAKLQKKGGGTPEETANNIRFKLEQVSREPGICINYPRPPECKDQPDLQFRMADNPRSRHVMVLDDHRAVRTPYKDEKLTIADVVVSSFDYGAFGLVEATCELESGRQLTAHLKGDEGRYSLRLPKSREGSHIADCWRERYHAEGDDRADEDDSPKGDGHKGDGFTLFEEYRGFVHNHRWSDMDPNVKDFFIINKIGGDIQPGIEQFRQATGMKVHEIDELETDFKVVNFNYTIGPSHVNQHAVMVVLGTSEEISRANGGPATPKDIDYVEIAHAGLLPAVNSVAHELLHCCNVWHHGDIDPWWVYWEVEIDDNGDHVVYPATVELGDDGKVSDWRRTPDSKPIRVFFEDMPGVQDLPVYLQTIGIKRVFIAVPHGQHSGDENCHMRYQVAFAYPKGPPNEYYWVAGTERRQRILVCTTVQGHDDGINKPGRLPRPRYYEADTASKRGKCALQILVNDAVRAPRRDVVAAKGGAKNGAGDP